MYRPVVSNLNANSVGILNTIRDNASAEYFNAVPRAEQTTESIRAVGTAILAYQPRMNEFVNALVNRIARVVVTSKMYANPWAFAKKGILEYGETIEEIFVNIAESKPFSPETADVDVFKRYLPDVRSAFHAMNLQTVYPVTISNEQLRQAFLSMDGVTDLIARIVNSLYSAANYDEFIMMKYLIGRLALDGVLPITDSSAVSDEASGRAFVKSVKGLTNALQFNSTAHNIAGVLTYTNPEDIYFITTAALDAAIDVDVLAAAFNLDKVSFVGRRVMVDSFGFNATEHARLAKLLADDPGYQPITESDNAALQSIQGVVMDRDFFQIYDNLNQYTENYNGIGLYWNEFNHVWRTYSASPFANVALFASAAGSSVTSVSVTAPASANAGDVVRAMATVVATGFANRGVTWAISGDSATIDADGVIKFGSAAAGSYTVTATSVYDSTKNGTATITIS